MRIAWVVGHQPVLAYPHQSDPSSISSCLGLWPNQPEPPAHHATQPDGPAARYFEGQRRPAECLLSSELAFASVAMAAWKVAADVELASPRSMDSRFTGTVKALTLIALAIVLTIALRERPPWMVANAAVFGIVLADPIVTLFMNSLGTEFATALFSYAAIGCLVVITGIAPERTGWYLAFAASLAGLGLSRPQYALLPLGLAILALPVAWRYKRLSGILLVVMAAAISIIETVVITRAPVTQAAASVDVVLGTLLPASRNPDRALAALALPGRCESVIGATSAGRIGESVADRCPEAQTLRTARLASLLATEPSIAVRVMAKAAPMLQSALLHHLGIEAGKRSGRLAEQTSPLVRSIGQLTERIPLAGHVGWLMFLFAALAIAIIAWAIDGIAWGTSVGPLATAALAGTAVHALLTSVFGSGLVDLARHAHLASVASHALLVVGIVAAFLGFVPRRTQRVVAGSIVGRSTSMIFIVSLLGAILAIAMSSVIWIPAYRTLSLAVGAVDELAGVRPGSRQVLLRGWALDPLAPPTVYAIVNETTRIDSRPARNPDDPVGAELARLFPRHLEPANARFEIPIDTGLFAGKPIRVKTYAASPDGVVTEIDRRTLAAPPEERSGTERPRKPGK